MNIFSKITIICTASLALVITIGLLLPQKFVMPVEGAGRKDYNDSAFWYYPWGKSVTHKGVDIFSPVGTTIKSSTYGIVFDVGYNGAGGNYVLILGPKWRMHYYAHLEKTNITSPAFVKPGDIIGSLGTTGNAAGKSPHLHYSICTLIPYLLKADSSIQGWKKMFYLNPIDYLSPLFK